MSASTTRIPLLGEPGCGGQADSAGRAGHLGHDWSEIYGQIDPILRQLVDGEFATCTEKRRKGKPMRNLCASSLRCPRSPSPSDRNYCSS